MLFIIFLFIIYISCIKLRRHEKFTNYRKISVTPKKILFDKLVLNTFFDNSTYLNIGKNLNKIFPFYEIKLSGGSFSNINLTNKYSNYLSLVQDDAYFNFIKNNKNNDLRYLLSIGVEQFTLITKRNSSIKSWNDLRFKNIGSLNQKTASNFVLQKIIKSFRLQSKIITCDISSISKFLSNGDIDAFFMVISNPNSLFRKINKQIPLKFIGFNDLDKNILNKIFPFANKAKIDVNEYNIPSLNTINTLETKIDIICNKNLDPEHSYNLIKTIFSKLLFIKTNGDNDFKLQMKEFNPSYLYPVNSLYKLHEGVHKFYIDIGVITYKDDTSCKYTVGIKKCKGQNINNFRLI